MKELILKAKQSNWGIIGPGSWTSKKWKIYSDLSVEIKSSYMPLDKWQQSQKNVIESWV